MKKGHPKVTPKSQSKNNLKKSPKLPPRCERLAKALLLRGSFSREEADRIGPASNSPHYMMLIRNRLNIVLECEKVEFVNSDGEKSWYGRYVASDEDKRVIRDYFSDKGVLLA